MCQHSKFCFEVLGLLQKEVFSCIIGRQIYLRKMKNKKQKYIRESRFLFNQQPPENADDLSKNPSSRESEDSNSDEKEKVQNDIERLAEIAGFKVI